MAKKQKGILNSIGETLGVSGLGDAAQKIVGDVDLGEALSGLMGDGTSGESKSAGSSLVGSRGVAVGELIGGGSLATRWAG
jgi:hypothetical protein